MVTCVLNRIDDPRDNLEKARRVELLAFAQLRGVSEINEAMPAKLIRRILRDKGFTDIRIPRRQLGSAYTPPTDPRLVGFGQAPIQTDEAPPVREVDELSDLVAQFSQQKSPKPKAVSTNELNELRMECKRRGIKMVRGDNKETLKAKLDAQNAH